MQRILRTHADRSDRGIAEMCGVSPKTVARVRDELRDCGGLATSAIRVGRDGRARPVDPAEVRERIVHELEEHPDASLRFIAKKVGASPETVRSRTSPVTSRWVSVTKACSARISGECHMPS